MTKTRIGAVVLTMFLLLATCFIGGFNMKSAAEEIGDDRVDFHFLNVNSIELEKGGPIGSADCIIIDDHGIITLVDTGYSDNASRNKICNYLKNMGVEKITNLFITHWHNDHVGGVAAICENFDVVNCYYTLVKDWSKLRPLEFDWDTKGEYDRAMLALKEKINSDGSIVNMIQPDEEGKVYKLTENSSFTVYNSLSAVNNNFREPEFNDFSMMMKYSFKNVNALLTGDINIQYEYLLKGEVTKDGKKCDSADENAIAPVGEIQILKVAHHGTEGSLHTENLLNRLNPTKNINTYAVVTGYKGNVGGSTVPRLTKYGYNYYITHDGDVVISTDGTNIKAVQKAE